MNALDTLRQSLGPDYGLGAYQVIPREALERVVAAVDEARMALEGVIRVADRRTVEFDAARSALAALADHTEEKK